jgi:hypothetical protein
MYNLTSISSPLGIAVFVAITVLIYLYIMSISIFLPPVLILSIIVGLIVYQAQSKCVIVKPVVSNVTPQQNTVTTPQNIT